MNPLDLFALGVFALLCVLFWRYQTNYRKPEIFQRELSEYLPPVAWLRAGILFCLFFLLAWAAGTVAALLSEPLASSEQLADNRWRLWVLGLLAFIFVAYWGIWARYTIRFDRRLDLFPQIAFGLLWGLAFGLVFVTIWRFAERIGASWAAWQTWFLAYVLIGVWQWLLMDMYWDVYISPEHDNAKSIKLKVFLTHIPNVTLSLVFLALYGNGAIFIALQTLALVGCSINMRMLAPWSQEKTLPARRTPSIFWGLSRCGGYLSPNPENDRYLKAAHL